MQQNSDSPIRTRQWGVPASVAAHAALIALLIFGLPLPDLQPEEPEAIAVELVPPPEPEQAEEEPPEEAEEEEAPEEEEPAQEQTEEEAEEETPPPEEAADAEAQASAPPIQALRPVFAFGEEDTGPREATDGNAATDGETPDAALDPAPEPVDEAAAPLPEQKPPLELTEARTLFSRSVSDNPLAMTAMAGLSRGERGGELCATELREQLRNDTPPWGADLLPAYRLGDGTVIEVRNGAFRARGQWYDLSFRCAVDGEATRVLSFAFDVGAAIPRSEWAARGFPGG